MGEIGCSKGLQSKAKHFKLKVKRQSKNNGMKSWKNKIKHLLNMTKKYPSQYDLDLLYPVEGTINHTVASYAILEIHLSVL